MVVRPHFCALEGVKCVLCVVEENIFQCVARTCKLTLCLLSDRVSELDEVDEAVFQGLDGSHELILNPMTVPKRDLWDVEKSMLQGVVMPCEIISFLQDCAK